MRIKYCSKYDLNCGCMLQEIEKYLESIDTKKIDSINDIIEIYNINRFFDNDVYMVRWDEIKKSQYKNKAKEFIKHASKYLEYISSGSLKEKYYETELEYKNDFWEVLSAYNIIKKNPSIINKDVLDVNMVYSLLHTKNLAKKYDRIIKEILITDESLAETIISYDINKTKDFYLPAFSLEELEKAVDNYINSDSPNPNYLNYIYSIGRIESQQIGAMHRIQAKEKADSIYNSLPNSNKNKLSFKISIAFKNVEDIIKLEKSDNLSFEIAFDEEWIKNHLDYPTLLNNLIFIFGFVDNEFRTSFIKKSLSNESIFSLLGIHSPNEYSFDINRRFLEMYSSIVTRSYSEVLKKYDINVEDIIEWFFKEYLAIEFKIEGFVFNKTTCGSTYLEKCRMLFAELDGVLKQYDFYCKNHCLNREALDLSNSVKSKDISSLVSEKYVFCNDTKLTELINDLFSNKSPLNLWSNNTDYNSFVEAILKGKIAINNIPVYLQQIITNMIDYDILSVYDSVLSIENEKIILFKDLFENDELSLNHLTKTRKITEKYIKEGKFGVKSALLTKEEADYFDYMLNNKTFDNNRAIRNSYMHGTNPLDVNHHINTYYLIIKFLLLLIIKINDDIQLSKQV